MIKNLELERLSLLATIYQFGKNDGRMNTKTNEMCKNIEKRIKDIEEEIRKELSKDVI